MGLFVETHKYFTMHTSSLKEFIKVIYTVAKIRINSVIHRFIVLIYIYWEPIHEKHFAKWWDKYGEYIMFKIFNDEDKY